MGVSFTEEQQRVIDTHGCNMLVSASAGSGKTAVLVERIVKMISDKEHPVDIDRLLVVTFTNAAAAEMRERISQAIASQLERDAENEHLQKQATLIHNAQITTIDSFCMFVIRNNFNDIGLDPGFRVADEGELKLLKQEVMKEFLEERFVKKNPSFLHCVEYFSSGSRDNMLEEYIGKLYLFAESYPWPSLWLEERKKDYDFSSIEEMEQTGWMKFGMEQVKYAVEDGIRKLKECLRICEQPDGPYMYGEVLEREQKRLEALMALKEYREGYFLFQGMVFERLPSKKDASVSSAKRELVQSIRNGVKDILKEINNKYFPVSPETVLKYMQGSAQAVCQLIELTAAYKEALDKRKRDNNLIDFSDMEHLALSILVKKEGDTYEPTKTAQAYCEYFTEILIDEYQDSNLVQECLLESISGEKNGNYNRFMVGDVKQSIYKFRLARPEIFMEKYENYALGEPEKLRIDLHKNFRSRREVLTGINYIFAQIMGKELGGVEYDKEASLIPGAEYGTGRKEADARLSNRTELLLVKKEQETEGARKLSVREREAYAVAERIKELVKNFKVTDKVAGDENNLRPAGYRDIVILLRTNAGWDEDFKRILKEEGIPAHVASKTGYFAAQEIQNVLQLLRILDNPQQDIPLFGVMKSYYGGFTEEEIARIHGAEEENKGRNLYFSLKEFADQSSENEALAKKTRDFLQFLEKCRDKSVYMPIHELLRETVIESGYLRYVTALPGGEQRRANVEILLEKAAAFEHTSYYGLFHFIRYMEQLEKYDVDYGEANILDENADVVRIMSIHKSKGLEFPICFVSGLAKRFNTMDTSGKLIADVDMGIGVDYVDARNRLQSRTIRKNILAEKMRLDNLGEELRILYVALTRAKEKLILTGIADKLENRLNMLKTVLLQEEQHILYSDLAGASSYLDFILPALARHPSFLPIWREMEEEQTECHRAWMEEAADLYAGAQEIEIKIIGEQEFAASQIKNQLEAEAAKRKLMEKQGFIMDEEMMTMMSEKFSYSYEHQNLAELYTKTTVSELKRAGLEEKEDSALQMFEAEEVVPYLPEFVQTKEVLSGAGRGSAFHKVMELMDFEDGRQTRVEEQVQRMQEEGYLSEEFAQAVSIPLIQRFMESSLAKRMEEAEQRGCLFREQPFVLGISAKELKEQFPEDELVLIQGIIDVYFEEDGELVVADYKTDRVRKPEELVEKYHKQLEYYARALEQLTGKRVKEKVIYSFGLEKEIVL